jgi:hypothetical protein
MSATKKGSFHARVLPAALSDLPRYGVTSSNTSSRSENERDDFAYGVRSIDDLEQRLRRGFADPTRPKSRPRPRRK